MSGDDYITRAQYEELIRRRTRAIDLALTAFIQTIERELPEDPGLIDSMRAVAARIRTTFSVRYPFAREDLGGGG